MANVNFTNIKSIGLPFGACPIGIEGLTEDLIAENGGIINATQIDWNGAQVAGKTLNTTGELLSN